MSFGWTYTGRNLFLACKTTPPSVDFAITRDGPNQWVFRHWSTKAVCAVFTGDNATQALRALKVALVTYRLNR